MKELLYSSLSMNPHQFASPLQRAQQGWPLVGLLNHTVCKLVNFASICHWKRRFINSALWPGQRDLINEAPSTCMRDIFTHTPDKALHSLKAQSCPE